MEVRLKILNGEACRICLNVKDKYFINLNNVSSETNQKPVDLIEKFQLFELTENVTLNIICKACALALDSFYKFYLVAKSSQSEILKILNEVQIIDTEVVTIRDEVAKVSPNESDNESEANCSSESRFETKSLKCEYCSKIYMRQAHLDRHTQKCYQDGLKKRVRRQTESHTCQLCGIKFKKRDDLKVHFNVASCVGNDNPVCRFCNEILPDLHQLNDHLRLKHPKGREHACSICTKTFPSAGNRNAHLQSHNAYNSFKCEICDQTFKSTRYLAKHNKSIHKIVENSCPICERLFFTQQKFDYHIRSHESVKRYQCPDCDKSFMQSHHLENHKALHTGIKRFLCFKCGREFKQECNLKAHLRVHTDDKEKKFKCSDCEKMFSATSLLRSHFRRQHEQNNFTECPECGKNFTTRSSFRDHFHTHFRDPSDRPFKCNFPGCNKSFYRERSLKYHNSISHGSGDFMVKKTSKKTSNLIYICDFCNKTFTLQSLFKQHVVTHIESEQRIRKHKCNICDAIFKRTEHLRTHMNAVHLKVKPHRCEHIGCGKSFSSIGDKNVHLNVHSDVKPHVCSICQKSFRLTKGLKAHLKTHRNNKFDENKVDPQVKVTEAAVASVIADEGMQHEAGTQLMFFITAMP